MTTKLSFDILVKRNISSACSSDEEKIEELMEVTHVRLDRENIGIIDNLELLGPRVTNLYLQHNIIEKIENLECLLNLTFLVLSENKISKVEGLTCLKKLTFLDLNTNKIEDLEVEELPATLKILSLRRNLCRQHPDYRRRLLSHLPHLQLLDRHRVNRADEEDNSGSDTDDSEGPPQRLFTDEEVEIEDNNEAEREEEKRQVAPSSSGDSPSEFDFKGEHLRSACTNLLRTQTQTILERSQTRLEESMQRSRQLNQAVLEAKKSANLDI